MVLPGALAVKIAYLKKVLANIEHVGMDCQFTVKFVEARWIMQKDNIVMLRKGNAVRDGALKTKRIATFLTSY